MRLNQYPYSLESLPGDLQEFDLDACSGGSQLLPFDELGLHNLQNFDTSSQIHGDLSIDTSQSIGAEVESVPIDFRIPYPNCAGPGPLKTDVYGLLECNSLNIFISVSPLTTSILLATLVYIIY